MPAFPDLDFFSIVIVDNFSGRDRLLAIKTQLELAPDPAVHGRPFFEFTSQIEDFAGTIVSFELTFDSGDANGNDGLGVVIDTWRIEWESCPD